MSQYVHATGGVIQSGIWSKLPESYSVPGYSPNLTDAERALLNIYVFSEVKPVITATQKHEGFTDKVVGVNFIRTWKVVDKTRANLIADIKSEISKLEMSQPLTPRLLREAALGVDNSIALLRALDDRIKVLRTTL